MKVITLQFRVRFRKRERNLSFGDAVNCYYSAQTVVGELNVGLYRWWNTTQSGSTRRNIQWSGTLPFTNCTRASALRNQRIIIWAMERP